ncbi:MAG TPA: tetratricopeptide repeat protein [Vicinamibacterales bacterium]|nr:tetratricopeptide repeat protein [Vicinamibacterales bacterium]
MGASRVVVAMLALGSFTAVGCAKVGKVQAMRSLKEANKAYQAQDYKKAGTLYADAIQAAPDDPDVISAYFFLGNCYDNQWKPSKKGEPENDKLLTMAVQNYETAAQKLSASDRPDYKKLATLSLQYLVAAYGADKMNDPAKAEPVLQKMIQTDPGDPTNYFALAKLYEDAGAYDAAEQMLVKAKEAKPGDPAVYMTLAGYYNRQGQFDKTIEALQERASKEPNNPEAFYTISTFYWDKAFRDSRLKEAEKRDYLNKGIQAVDHALQIKPDYAEALVYKGLLLRLQANMEKDQSKVQALLKEADALRDKAQELRKQKASGVGN